MSENNKLKALRTKKGLTYRGLAKATGIGIATLYRYETEKGNLERASLKRILKLCEALDCSQYDLFDPYHIL